MLVSVLPGGLVNIPELNNNNGEGIVWQNVAILGDGTEGTYATAQEAFDAGFRIFVLTAAGGYGGIIMPGTQIESIGIIGLKTANDISLGGLYNPGYDLLVCGNGPKMADAGLIRSSAGNGAAGSLNVSGVACSLEANGGNGSGGQAGAILVENCIIRGLTASGGSGTVGADATGSAGTAAVVNVNFGSWNGNDTGSFVIDGTTINYGGSSQASNVPPSDLGGVSGWSLSIVSGNAQYTCDTVGNGHTYDGSGNAGSVTGGLTQGTNASGPVNGADGGDGGSVNGVTLQRCKYIVSAPPYITREAGAGGTGGAGYGGGSVGSSGAAGNATNPALTEFCFIEPANALENGGTNGPVEYHLDIAGAVTRDKELENLSYNDLADLPTLGTAAAAATGDFATAAQGATADSALQPGYSGTTTNDDPPVGSPGQLISQTLAVGSAISLTTNTAISIISISLTAGDWDVTGVVDFHPGALTTGSYFQGGISATNNALGTQDQYASAPMALVAGLGVDVGLNIPVSRLSLASTTTIYLTCKAGFSTSTLTAYGTIRARRIR